MRERMRQRMKMRERMREREREREREHSNTCVFFTLFGIRGAYYCWGEISIIMYVPADAVCTD
jgi:hypothetical protein